MATKHEYKVANGGQPLLIIDTNGNIRPNSVFGKTFFVDYRNGSDTNDGLSRQNAFKTLSQAHTACTSNNGDVVYVDGDSTVVETAMITWSKNRTTVIGVGGLRTYGQAAKISLGVTTAATDIATLKVTGVRCNFYNLKFINNNTVAEGIYCVVDAGEYTHFDHCEIYKSTDLNVTGAAELVSNGDSSRYTNCTIGSSADAISGAIIRPCVLFTKAIVAGKVSRDVTFENCNFWRKCGDTTNCFMYGANATDIERVLHIKNCTFWNTKLAAATPAQNVAFAAEQTEGYVFLDNCQSIGAATAMSTTTGVFVSGPNQTSGAGGAEIGIALQAS